MFTVVSKPKSMWVFLTQFFDLTLQHSEILRKELLNDESEAWESRGRSSVSIDIA